MKESHDCAALQADKPGPGHDNAEVIASIPGKVKYIHVHPTFGLLLPEP